MPKKKRGTRMATRVTKSSKHTLSLQRYSTFCDLCTSFRYTTFVAFLFLTFGRVSV